MFRDFKPGPSKPLMAQQKLKLVEKWLASDPKQLAATKSKDFGRGYALALKDLDKILKGES